MGFNSEFKGLNTYHIYLFNLAHGRGSWLCGYTPSWQGSCNFNADILQWIDVCHR